MLGYFLSYRAEKHILKIDRNTTCLIKHRCAHCLRLYIFVGWFRFPLAEVCLPTGLCLVRRGQHTCANQRWSEGVTCFTALLVWQCFNSYAILGMFMALCKCYIRTWRLRGGRSGGCVSTGRLGWGLHQKGPWESIVGTEKKLHFIFLQKPF